MTEREKMLSGELYDPTDKELEQLRLNARSLGVEPLGVVLLKEFNRPSASYESSFYEFKTERIRKRKS